MTAVPMTTIVSKSWSIFFFSNLLLLLCKIWIDARIDELVGEWTSKLLGAPLTAEEQIDLVSVPVVSGENGPRPKLVNRFSCRLQLHGTRWQRTYYKTRY